MFQGRDQRSQVGVLYIISQNLRHCDRVVYEAIVHHEEKRTGLDGHARK